MPIVGMKSELHEIRMLIVILGQIDFFHAFHLMFETINKHAIGIIILMFLLIYMAIKNDMVTTRPLDCT